MPPALLGRVLAALAVVGMVIFVLHDRLDQGRRPRVAVATFAAVALLSFCQSMLLEVDTTAGAFPNLTAAAATAALSSLGTAGAAFLAVAAGFFSAVEAAFPLAACFLPDCAFFCATTTLPFQYCVMPKRRSYGRRQRFPAA